MALLNIKICLAIILVLLAIFDLIRRRIPNMFTFSVALSAIGFHFINSNKHFEGMLFSLAGLLTGIGLLFPLHLLGMMGAGDVKLMGAIGAVLGPKGTFAAFIFSAIIGGVYALLILIFNNKLRSFFLKRFFLMGKIMVLTGQAAYVPASEDEKNIKLCYGIPISIGTIIYMTFEYIGYPSWALFLSSL